MGARSTRYFTSQRARRREPGAAGALGQRGWDRWVQRHALRQLIRIRKQEPAEVEEIESLLDVYRRALGM